MDWKKSFASQSVDNYERFEQLVERGRQMHSQAVFELFAGLVSHAIPLLKIGNRMTFRRPNSGNYNTSRTPIRRMILNPISGITN